MTPKTKPAETVRKADQLARHAAMAVFAEASADDLAAALSAIGELPPHSLPRPPECGLVMLRGRIGGDGAAFNLGEATVTRAAVQLDSGELGFSYALGRDTGKARLAALCDAMWQSDAHHAAVETTVVAPLRRRIEDQRAQAQARTAATRVDFFTLVRGED